MNYIVTCNKCESLFRSTEPVKVEDGDIWFYYIECPECHAKYLTIITDAKLREGIAEIFRLNGLVKVMRETGKPIEKMQNRLLKLSAKNKSAGDALRAKYRSRFSELVESAYEAQ